MKVSKIEESNFYYAHVLSLYLESEETVYRDDIEFNDVYIAHSEDGVFGCVIAKERSPRVKEIWNMYVDPSARGIGVASLLLNALEIDNNDCKLLTHVFTYNYNVLFSLIKRGYLIEGLMRGNGGSDVYMLGKSKA